MIVMGGVTVNTVDLQIDAHSLIGLSRRGTAMTNREGLYQSIRRNHIVVMSVLDIALMGNPVLAQRAAPVQDPADPTIGALVADMMDTLAVAKGVGLAAPQVHRSLRLVIFTVPPERSGAAGPVPLTVLINPEIVPLGEEMEEAFEGCLSVPGLTGRVPRWWRIGYRALGLDGRLIEREAEGFHARVVQHECDHLWGRLYLSCMRDMSSLAFTEELRRQMEAANTGV
jgi:peptide deformylase